MDAEREPPPLAKLRLPADNVACGAVCVVLFVGTFVALAVDNLAAYARVPLVGIVASVVWIALVAFVLVVAVATAGVRASVVACLGPFSKRHFADARTAGDRPLIGFGYELFGRRWYFLRVRPEQVVSVNAGTGQATALAGRDMRDWSVVLRFRAGERPPATFEGQPIDEVYLIGPARAKEQTAELLAAVVAFLREAGVDLRPTDRDTEFRAAG